MSECTRCNGDGWIAGHWMPEPCPECGGDGDFRLEPEHDNGAAGVAFAAVGLAICIVIAVVWPVVEFFAAVLG